MVSSFIYSVFSVPERTIYTLKTLIIVGHTIKAVCVNLSEFELEAH